MKVSMLMITVLILVSLSMNYITLDVIDRRVLNNNTLSNFKKAVLIIAFMFMWAIMLCIVISPEDISVEIFLLNYFKFILFSFCMTICCNLACLTLWNKDISATLSYGFSCIVIVFHAAVLFSYYVTVICTVNNLT